MFFSLFNPMVKTTGIRSFIPFIPVVQYQDYIMIEQHDINPAGGEELLPGSAPEPEGSVPLTRPLNLPNGFDHFPGLGRGLLETRTQIRLYVRGFPEPITLALNDMAIVGRSDPKSRVLPAVRLDDYGALGAGVSRQHIALLSEPQFIKVMDLSSSNGTYLNGRKLVPYQPRILRDGDELRLGNLLVRIHFG